MTQEYAQSGEFLDIFSRDAWVSLREPVTAALAGAAPAAGRLVDLGAGSGRGVRVLTGLAPRWHVMTPEGLEAELAAARLTGSHGPHGLLRAAAG